MSLLSTLPFAAPGEAAWENAQAGTCSWRVEVKAEEKSLGGVALSPPTSLQGSGALRYRWQKQ